MTLRELNLHMGGNYLHEPSIVAAAAALPTPNDISTALIGKLGPVAIFDPTALKGAGTLVVDDSTGPTSKSIPSPMLRTNCRPASSPRIFSRRSRSMIRA